MKKEKGIKFVCDLCGELLEDGRPRFVCRGELFCGFEGLEIDEDLERTPESIQEELTQLIKELEKRPERELTDEVYFPFTLDLCRRCRDRVYAVLRSGEEK
ncbi:MAG: hypothetical protein ABIH23_04035 [bacterium]